MRFLLAGIGVAILGSISAGVCEAASLRVAPTRLEVVAPGETAVLDLENTSKRPINVQIRIFRWRQIHGIEQLEPTSGVAVSPPAVLLAPHTENIVRVVRLSKKAVTGEESYRVVIDELPESTGRGGSNIKFVLRHSIPVFFRNAQATPPKVSWSLTRSGADILLTARNDGDTRIRLSNLSLHQGGRMFFNHHGLIGYALGTTTMRWPVGKTKNIASGSLTLTAHSDTGPLNVNVAIDNR